MSSCATPSENIVLIGFMGCGKSTVGRELQLRLGFPLADMDQIIEQRAGKPVTAIFADDGEQVFRDMETALLKELGAPDAPRRIISTGGGAVVREENRDLIKNLGYVVWLDAPVKVILERTRKNRTRPLLLTEEDPEERIRKMMEMRRPIYQETAHLKLDTGGLDCGELATGILECARYHFSNLP